MNAHNGRCNPSGVTYHIGNVNQLNHTNTTEYSNNTVRGGMPSSLSHGDNANVGDKDGANKNDPILQPGQNNGGGHSETAINHNLGQTVTNNQYCGL